MQAEKRTALVTGGTGGLGEAIARALHDAGHTVLVIHSPGNSSIGAWLETQAGEGYTFAAYGADVADHGSCLELADRIQADGHRVDILVNNAGITRDATFRKLSYADWDAVDEWPGDVENGVEIDPQDGIPIGVAQLAERSITRDARVVDQNVDVVTVCLNEAGQLLAGGMVGHIRAVGGEVVTFAGLGFQPRANAGIARRMDDEHGMARIVQGPGDGFAQAAAAAGDQCSALLSRHCDHLSWLVRPCPVPWPTPLPIA